jgi:peroxiredoxin
MEEKWKVYGVTAGQTAPDVSLPDSAGGQMSLSESLKKGLVLAAFFKVSCPTSQFTMPFIERLYRAYGNGPVSFWGISQDDAKETQEFSRQFGVTFPMALDHPSYDVSRSYGFRYVPSLYLIEPSGKIRFAFSHFSKADLIRLSNEIASALGRPPAPVFLPSEQVPETKGG